MPDNMTDKELYEKAKKRVEEKRGFFFHLSAYIVVNLVLVIIWAVSGGGYPWFLWTLGGWGIGIIFHFLAIFIFSRETGWEQRQIEKEMENLRKGKQQ